MNNQYLSDAEQQEINEFLDSHTIQIDEHLHSSIDGAPKAKTKEELLSKLEIIRTSAEKLQQIADKYYRGQ
jgi:hypothetical protein